MMETGYSVKGVVDNTHESEFVKDEECIVVPVVMNEFLEVRRLIIDEYERQERNERIHNVPMNKEIKNLKALYDATYNFLAEQEEVRCNG